MADSPLLEIRDLHIAFLRHERGLRRRIVRPVTGMDLTIDRGELVALVGGSGAGKTLLAHAALGLLPRNAREHGTIRFEGRPVDPAARRNLAGRRIALLPQSTSFLDPLTSVGAQIRRAAHLAGRTATADLAGRTPTADLAGRAPTADRPVDAPHRGVGAPTPDHSGRQEAPARDRDVGPDGDRDAGPDGDRDAGSDGDIVTTVLRERDLDPALARARPHELSGGQARRVLEAIATLGRPHLLFVDEPTPGLDHHAVTAVLDRLRRRADAGAAVVLITHDLAAAVRHADRIVACHGGRTISEAPPSAFAGDGRALTEPRIRALWRALPQNGLHVPAPAVPLETPDPAPAVPLETPALDVDHPTASTGVERSPILDDGGRARAALIGRDLRFTHRGRRTPTLHRASIRIDAGEIVGLIGPSGAGKSTLGRLLGGHLRPDSGHVDVDPSPTPTGAHPVQLVLQDAGAAMNPRHTIAAVLAEADPHRADPRTITTDPVTSALIDPGWLNRHPHELSGGELQRVNLARALLTRPRFVIADEISASLDPLTAARLWQMLRRQVRGEGIGMLAISHDRALLDVIADRIVEFAAIDPDRPGRSDRVVPLDAIDSDGPGSSGR